MKTLKQKLDLSNIDIVVYFFTISIIAYSLITFAYFEELLVQLVAEDGPAENLTALMLFAASVVSFYRVKQYAMLKKSGWVIAQILLAVFFFFAAGEELSWGQRIFNVQSGEFFQQHNLQGETNIHNLMVGDTKINKLVFSQLLFVVLVIYFVFLEFLAKKVKWIGNLVRYFNVPLPKLHHVVMMLASAIVIQGIYYSRHDELLECVFATIFFLIFLSPKKWTTDI